MTFDVAHWSARDQWLFLGSIVPTCTENNKLIFFLVKTLNTLKYC